MAEKAVSKSASGQAGQISPRRALMQPDLHGLEGSSALAEAPQTVRNLRALNFTEQRDRAMAAAAAATTTASTSAQHASADDEEGDVASGPNTDTDELLRNMGTEPDVDDLMSKLGTERNPTKRVNMLEYLVGRIGQKQTISGQQITDLSTEMKSSMGSLTQMLGLVVLQTRGADGNEQASSHQAHMV